MIAEGNQDEARKWPSKYKEDLTSKEEQEGGSPIFSSDKEITETDTKSRRKGSSLSKMGNYKARKTPDINQYQNEPYQNNPLMEFYISKLRHREVYDFLRYYMAKAKKEASEGVIIEEFSLIKPRKYVINRLRREAETNDPPPFLAEWTKNISKKLPVKLKKRFPEAFQSIIREVHEVYSETLIIMAVYRKLKLVDRDLLPLYYEKEFLKGKTENYSIFLQRVQELPEILFMLHPIIRHILDSAVELIPFLIFDFSAYRKNGFLSVSHLKNLIESDAKRVENILMQNWYPSIAGLLNRKDSLSDVDSKYWVRFVNCASNIMRSQVTELKRRTLHHLVEVSCDVLKVPLIQIDLLYDSGAKISPDLFDYINIFNFSIENVVGLASRLTSLETWVDVPCRYQWIPTDIQGCLVPNTYKAVQEFAERHFSEVLAYVEGLEKVFDELYTSDLMQEVLIFLHSPCTFESIMEKVKYIIKYRGLVQDNVANVYFSFGRLCQKDFLQNLKAFVEDYLNLFGRKLVQLHMDKNKSICKIFEEVAYKAKKPPNTSEELMGMGEYMLWARTVLLDQLRERIVISVEKLALLMEVISVTDEHYKLNSTTILWLQDIKSVFDQSSMVFEERKLEFEEALAKRTEKLNKDLDDVSPRLVIFNRMDETDHIAVYMHTVCRFLRRLEFFDREVAWINNEEAIFKFPLSTYPELDELKAIIHPFAKLIYLIYKWQLTRKVWLDGSFLDLNYEVVDTTIEDFTRTVTQSQKTYKIKLKQQAEENNPRRFIGNVDDPDNLPAPLRLCMKTLQEIKDFKPHVVFVQFLCNPTLTQRHWDEMSELVGFNLTPDAGTTLRKILDMNLKDYLKQFEIISIGANKEQALRTMLAKMKSEWVNMQFPLVYHKDTQQRIISSLTDIQALLDDHILQTLTMRGSVFVKAIEGEVCEWYSKLIRVSTTLEKQETVQAQWLYLFPIFSSEDIAKQMPIEGQLFQRINACYKNLISSMVANPLVMKTAGTTHVLETLQECTKMLESVSEGVNSYLDKKRLCFSRFFFLSNDEMLEILSETSDPLQVQPHLKKCFEGIAKLGFDSDLHIVAMFSAEDEKIEIMEPISTLEARGSVEKWLMQVEHQMRVSVRHQISISKKDYATSVHEQWVTTWPGQMVMCVSQIYWTAYVHKLLTQTPHELHSYIQMLATQLNSILELLQGTLNKATRTSLGTLVVLGIHAKSVVEDLLLKNVLNDEDFQWLAQLRYYWEEENVLVRCTNAPVRYAYEYLGNTSRLVITPLTDRCYRTILGAYHLHLNGAPEGSAGTGKTETVKDLAKAIAVQCVVFNCSDALDYTAMVKFFKGLASSGAWACLDEFNRIQLEVLSVIAQQISCIIQAIKGNAKTFIFGGTELKFNPGCYICITMDPGHSGCSGLPDNLKVLFRTVAMVIPDYTLIGEISLFSYGFMNAKALAVKLVTTYRLCSEQLPSQNHYDFGMRTMKSVLTAATNLKLKYPCEQEDVLLLSSIKDVNLPKILSQDIPLFEQIVADLFDSVSLPKPNYDELTSAIIKTCETLKLKPIDSFILKVIQTYKIMMVHHGFMLVGDPFAGKTSTLKVLAGALDVMNDDGLEEKHVQYRIINPKAVTIGQLFGHLDIDSHEWRDGIVANTFRGYAYSKSLGRKWVIFDGPVDALWIENINTVLDDSRKLCLTSGDMIHLTSQTSVIFEVMDLTQASPATVSRCGMVYFESQSLGWEPLIASWIENSNPLWTEYQYELLRAMFDWIFPAALWFVKQNGTQLVTAGTTNLVRSTLNLIGILLTDAVTNNNGDSEHMRLWIQAAFVYAVVWGIAGTLDEDSKERFDEFYKNIWKGTIEEYPIPDALEKVDIPIPPKGLLFDYVYNFKDKGIWVYWPEFIRSIETEESTNMQQTLVPTVDTARYQHVMDLHIRHHVPMLLVGQTGTGKSFYYQNMLMSKLSPDKYTPGLISFTPQTKANQIQDLVMSKLNKRRKGIYGPLTGKKCVIFIDNMNVPTKERYGAQPPLELLRQYFDHSHWYDIKGTTEVYLQDVLMVAAMGLSRGNCQDVYVRLLRHFNIYSINPFSEESMQKIFTTVLSLGLKRNNFSTDVMTSVVSMVHATMDIYKAAKNVLLPIPAKSHYIFSLRDISRVIQGCSLIKKDSVDNKRVFTRLWVHEVLRTFYDKLIDQTDKNWFYEILRTIVAEQFHEDFDLSLDTYADLDGKVTQDCLCNLIFGNFMDPDALEEDKKYEEIPSLERLLEIAEKALEEYNATHKTKMDIVLFRFALEHLSRICRVLVNPCGNALLVGVEGSGRQSLTKLSTYITRNEFFQPEITKTYSLSDWRNDLKKVLKQSGGRNTNTTFLFTEGQIKEETFLQDIDSLLNSGEVPNIFSVDQKQEILEMVRLAAQGGNRNLDINPLAVFSFFTNRCREKLHMVLCFSPIGSSFRTRLQLYPSLVNCCTIDWFQVWPEDALEKVAQKHMKIVHLPEATKRKIIQACKYFHVTSRNLSDKYFLQAGKRTYITSASYLEHVRSFTDLINQKQHEIAQAKQRYVGGLEKLLFASEQVSALQSELSALRPQLVIAAKETSLMMTVIERETVEVAKASAQVREDEAVANVQAAAAQELKNECEADLAQAIPILEDAIAALNTLKPTDITLVKSMKNPPDTVKLVMAAVCVMKDVKPDRINDAATGRKIIDYWGPSKKILGDMYFLQHLKDFDKDNIPPAIMRKIRTEYLPNKDFKPHVVAKASSAAEGLCKWVMAMDMYDAVAKEVAPKKEKLMVAEREYNATVELLEEKREQVRSLEEKLALLNTQLEDANARKVALEEEVELFTNKLIRAEKLIGGLGGEKTRWSNAAEALQNDYDLLAGDILISCGIIAYLAPFDATCRQECIADWHACIVNLQIPCSHVFSFRKVLGDELKIQNWNIDGLPRDGFSIDSAIIADKSRRSSLMVDPQGQANKWIKSMEQNGIRIVKFSDANYMKTIEFCVERGLPVLLENVLEELEAPLEPVLSKRIFKQGNAYVITLGENIVEYDPRFRFYMTSKLRNPHFLPEVYNKVTVVNFALSREGLGDQLLGIVVAKERPDLERKRQSLIVQGAANKAHLKQVEDDILKTLSQTTGNILENEGAIEVLDSSKVLSQEILQKEDIAKQKQDEIEEFRLKYKDIAYHSSVLYYCVTDLPNIDPMYQFSLGWFINLYITSIDKCQSCKTFKERLEALRHTFTYNLYNSVCRSLFEKDKLLFSFVLCTNILMSQNKVQKCELNFFLTGGAELDNSEPNPAPSWLCEKSWNEICRASELPAFEGFNDYFTNTISDWREFYDVPEPPYDALPPDWSNTHTDFQKLIVIRILRPDQILASVSYFIEQNIGFEYVISPPFDIERSFEDSDCLCPLIFILSMGADPMASLLNYAAKTGYVSKFQSISLGQGQGPIAEAMIRRAQCDGDWVCLQNCHLAASWMPMLERIWENMDRVNTSASFRLWLTSYPSQNFPVSILQFGVKMTNEPPTGLQHNLMHSYLSDPLKNPEFFDACPERDKEFSKLLFALAFFHAVVQERRKFGPIGWNIPYGFNESDFHISIMQLQMFMNESADVPYKAVSYVTGECNYGGQVTDEWDRRVLITLLNDFVNPDVIEDPKYMFSAAGPEYIVPLKTKYFECLSHIQTIPTKPPPEVFGLHMNAGIIRDQQESNTFINTMILVQGDKSKSEHQQSQQLLSDIVSDILNKLPTYFDVKGAMFKYPPEYKESTNIVLIQEMQRFNHLLRVLKHSLQNLKEAVNGLSVMSHDLEGIANSLLSGKVPLAWSRVSYPSLKPLGSYVSDFLERILFFQTWYENGKPPCFWLSGFYFTRGFLTGAMQNFARKYHISISLITFDYEVLSMDVTNESPIDGVYTHGLYLDGAHWNREMGMLNEQQPKILRDTMPLIWFKPIEKAKLSEGSRYLCPLYRTPERRGFHSAAGHSNYVLPVLLNTEKPVSHWIKRGVALICQLAD